MFAGIWQPEAKTLGLEVSHAALQLIAEIAEFKGKWAILRTLFPERVLGLRHVATVESVASSPRIEGVKLSDQEVETLLANLQHRAFRSRDEHEVADYAKAMDRVFAIHPFQVRVRAWTTA